MKHWKYKVNRKDRLCSKGAAEADFTGKLRGENVTLKDIKTKEISYIKRDISELNVLRNNFNTFNSFCEMFNKLLVDSVM